WLASCAKAFANRADRRISEGRSQGFPAERNHSDMSFNLCRNGARSEEPLVHQSLSPLEAPMPNRVDSIGLWRSPSITCVLDPEYLARVTAVFPATTVFPS